MIKLYDASEFTGLNIALALYSLTGRGGNIFAEPPPIDIDELLPDKFFDWDAIGIGEKEET